MLDAMRELSTQSAMKLGWRSQSWYIISQKHDMIANHARSRGSITSRIVRQSTSSTVSVLDAPEGVSIRKTRSRRLSDVKPADARNRLRQAPAALTPAWNGAGKTMLLS